MEITEAINRIIGGESLNSEQMSAVMRNIMTGGTTDAQIAAFLVALRMKGETADELLGGALIMRELSTKVEVSGENLVDTCGTGGDGSSLFNVSTASAIVAAAAGARVAKHGNRSVSSSSGSADVLEAADVRIDLDAAQVAQCINEIGVGFMFAPAHHGAMKYAIGPRREIATRTIFNLLGPLTNPAAAPNQVLGVFSERWLRPLAEVLQKLGSKRVMIVHSAEGFDEISPAHATRVCELRDGEIREYSVTPEELGVDKTSVDRLRAADPQASLILVRQALGEWGSPAANMVALNAGAAIYVSGVARNLPEGVAMAQDAIASGLAKNKLSELAGFTRCLKDVEQA